MARCWGCVADLMPAHRTMPSAPLPSQGSPPRMTLSQRTQIQMTRVNCQLPLQLRAQRLWVCSLGWKAPVAAGRSTEIWDSQQQQNYC